MQCLKIYLKKFFGKPESESFSGKICKAISMIVTCMICFGYFNIN